MSLDERIKARKMEYVKKSILSGGSISVATTCLTSREGNKDTIYSDCKDDRKGEEMMHRLSELEEEKLSLEYRIGELQTFVQM